MELPNELKWSVKNRLLTVGAMVGGLALVGLGFVLGFWGSIDIVLDDPTNISQAAEEANPVITLVLFLGGFLVWQFGKTYALFSTLPRASGRAAARRFDHEEVTDGVLEGLDERLTNLEVDMQETRRSVQELKRAEHASAFDLDDVDGSATDPEGDDSAKPSREIEPFESVIGEDDPEATAQVGGGDPETVTDRERPEPTPDDDDPSEATASEGGENEFTFGQADASDQPTTSSGDASKRSEEATTDDEETVAGEEASDGEEVTGEGAPTDGDRREAEPENDSQV